MALAGAKALQVYSLDEAERRFRRVLELSETYLGCADEFLVTECPVTKLARLFYYRGEFDNIIALVEPYLPRVWLHLGTNVGSLDVCLRSVMPACSVLVG